MMQRNWDELLLAFALGWALMALLTSFAARGADLPIPMPRPIEACVAPGVKPAPGQTIHTDDTCPSGLRWKIQK